jgi:hypothetical protein
MQRGSRGRTSLLFLREQKQSKARQGKARQASHRPASDMREVVLQPRELRGVRSVREAFDKVFGERTARALHGDCLLRLGDWEPAERRRGRGHQQQQQQQQQQHAGTSVQRRLAFNIDLADMPAALARFMSGGRTRVSVRQQATWAEEQEVTVCNHTRMHFLGAEMFRVRPRFRLRAAADDAVWLDGSIQNQALLPPPLNVVAEAFMAEQSRQQLQRFEEAVVALL